MNLGGKARRAALGVTLAAVTLAVAGCEQLLGINGDRPYVPLAPADAGPDATLPTGSVDGSVDTAVAVEAAPTGDASLATTASVANQNADDAVEAMLLAFWNGAGQYLSETPVSAGNPTPADQGSFSQAWDAVIDAAERHASPPGASAPGVRFVGTVETLYSALIGSSYPRYDQELFVVLAMIRAYDVTQNPSYLLAARTLFTDVETNGWDTNCCSTGANNPLGGVWRDKAHSAKSTSANAAAVIAAARLAQRTTGAASETYFAFAQKVYGYWSKYMVSATTGQVYDSVSQGGGVDTTTLFTYDQGLMIGAAVELGRVDHALNDASTGPELALAQLMAGFLLQKEVATVSVPTAAGTNTGPILSDGDDTICQADCIQYKGFAARYLAELYVAEPGHPEYADVLQRSADAALAIARDATTKLYNGDWGSPLPSGSMPLVSATASAAMVLSAAATIAGPPTVTTTPGSFLASEAVLNLVTLSTASTGFPGWAYVTSPGAASGEAVQYIVTVPKTDLYSLNFFYNLPNASMSVARDVSFNGGAATSTPFFPLQGIPQPQTPGIWDNTAVVVGSAPLQAGTTNSVAVVYNPSNGSQGSISFDQLKVSENLLPRQPNPNASGEWSNSFNPAQPVNLSAADGGVGGGTTWTGTDTINSTEGEWIKIYPQQGPFNVSLVPQQYYVASFTIVGSGSANFFLDFYTNTKDVQSAVVTPSSTPQTVQTPPFTIGAGNQAQLQLRTPFTGGGTVNIDVTVYDIGIYLVPAALP